MSILPPYHPAGHSAPLEKSIISHTPAPSASPPPAYEASVATGSSGQRYTASLAHGFDPSLTLPLWNPSPVAVGSVGYVSKDTGSFVTLLDAFGPAREDIQLPALQSYGNVTCSRLRRDTRHPEERALDTFQGRALSESCRRYSFDSQGAYLLTETTMHRSMEILAPAKAWFSDNVEAILRVFGAAHSLQKKDLVLVVGALEAPDYALFSGSSHGKVQFDISSVQTAGNPWGTFSGTGVEAHISTASASSLWDAVLISSLGFVDGEVEPRVL